MSALTVADIDEWLALLEAPAGMSIPDFVPNEWARTALGDLLGERLPHTAWPGAKLRPMLLRARAVAAGESSAP